MKTAAFFLASLFALVLSAASYPVHAASTCSPATPFSIDTIPVVGAPSADDLAFTKVKREASFPGGDVAWQAFLGSNLKPNTPVKHKAPAGDYVVVVQFVVDTDGKITEIKPLTAHGYGMEEEVVRVIKKSPRWIPALIEKGVKVKAYRKQPISFVVSDAK